MIVCRTLGPAQVALDGAEPPPELLWRKHLALLIYLARSPRRARSREHLIGLLWADKPDAAARHSLREAVHVLRRSLGEGGVEVAGEQVRLADGAVELDVDRLEALAGRADWAGAAALAQGEFLEGFGVPDAPAFDEWLAAERALWRRRSIELLLSHAGDLARAGRAGEAVAPARRALALDPLSEAAAAGAMRALALAGERAAALETFQGLATRLELEIGSAPSEPLRALAERVRSERQWRLPGAEARVLGAESRRAPLLGREGTLAAALGAWDSCRAPGRATLVVVEGDPGTGRTRMVEEIVARARLDGAATAVARAVPADRDEMWSGVQGLARGGLLEAPGVPAAPCAALAAFAARLPEWADRFPAARAADPAAPGPALAEVVRAVADERPVLLALDDAQWSDPETLGVLDAVLRDLAAAPLTVVLTTTGFPPRSEVDQLCGRIGRDVAGAAVRLGPLDLDALRTLAAWAMPAYGPAEADRLARRVAADSAGLPLLAVELLHAVAVGLDLVGETGRRAWPAEHRTLEETLPGDLPEGVIAAIRTGFRRLSRDAQTLLAAAAVLGDRVPGGILGRATGIEGDRLAIGLDELEWRRWLTAEGRGYAFTARVVRDIVGRDMLTAGGRARVLEAAGLKATAAP